MLPYTKLLLVNCLSKNFPPLPFLSIKEDNIVFRFREKSFVLNIQYCHCPQLILLSSIVSTCSMLYFVKRACFVHRLPPIWKYRMALDGFGAREMLPKFQAESNLLPTANTRTKLVELVYYESKYCFGDI